MQLPHLAADRAFLPCCLQDPCLSALLLDKLPVPGVLPACRPEAESRCDACATHLHQLTREALHLLQAPASREDPDVPRGGLVPSGPGAMTSPRDTPSPVGRQPPAPPDRRKGLAWPAGSSVQVSVAPAGLGGALSTVTIQAQPCLEGMWNVSRASSFLPPTCLVSAGHIEIRAGVLPGLGLLDALVGGIPRHS